MKKRSLASKIFFIALILVLAAVDQLTKILVTEQLKPVGSIPLIKIGDTEWLNFTYCENTGMSFSLLEGHRVILIAVPVLLIALVIWFVFTGKMMTDRNDVMIALGALAGGGLGNLIDRVLQGYVVDFIDVRIINFAIFNFADICAVCGGIYFGAVLLIEEIKEDREKKAEDAAGSSGSEGKTDDGQA